MMMTMNADPGAARSKQPGSRRAKTVPLTCMDVTAFALRKAGCSDDSQQPQFLARYAQLKAIAPEVLQAWLDGLTPEQMLALRYVLEAAVSDCGGDPAALTIRPYLATADQLKLVQQYASDGTPICRFRLPRLNTTDALDDALSCANVPPLRRA
jgi:hypothetical protein